MIDIATRAMDQDGPEKAPMPKEDRAGSTRLQAIHLFRLQLMP
jgi:hypothetical protein